MTDEPKDDIDDETISAFTKILEKVGPEWLKKHAPQSPKDTNPSPPGPTPSLSLESFLQSALADQKKEAATLREQMEAMRELLTPEQLILLRSRKSGNADENPSPPKNGPPAKPPAPNALKRPRWL